MPDTIIKGSLRLRPAVIGDVETAMPWYSDPEVLRYSEDVSDPYNSETVTRMYRYLMESGELYIIEVLENGKWKAIGDACLMKNSVPIVIGSAEYRSRGYGKIVLGMLIERAIMLGWQCVKVKGIYSHNTRSLRLFESMGFKRTGESARKNGTIEYSYSLDIAKRNPSEGKLFGNGN